MRYISMGLILIFASGAFGSSLAQKTNGIYYAKHATAASGSAGFTLKPTSLANLGKRAGCIDTISVFATYQNLQNEACRTIWVTSRFSGDVKRTCRPPEPTRATASIEPTNILSVKTEWVRIPFRVGGIRFPSMYCSSPVPYGTVVDKVTIKSYSVISWVLRTSGTTKTTNNGLALSSTTGILPLTSLPSSTGPRNIEPPNALNIAVEAHISSTNISNHTSEVITNLYVSSNDGVHKSRMTESLETTIQPNLFCQGRKVITQTKLDLFQSSVMREYQECGMVQIFVISERAGLLTGLGQHSTRKCSSTREYHCPTLHQVNQYSVTVLDHTTYYTTAPFKTAKKKSTNTVPALITKPLSPNFSITPVGDGSLVELPKITSAPAVPSHITPISSHYDHPKQPATTKPIPSGVQSDRAFPANPNLGTFPFSPGQFTPGNFHIALPDGQRLVPGSSTIYKGHTIIFSPAGDSVTIDGKPVDVFFAADTSAIPSAMGIPVSMWAASLPDNGMLLLAPSAFLDQHKVTRVYSDGNGNVLIVDDASTTLSVSLAPTPIAVNGRSTTVLSDGRTMVVMGSSWDSTTVLPDVQTVTLSKPTDGLLMTVLENVQTVTMAPLPTGNSTNYTSFFEGTSSRAFGSRWVHSFFSALGYVTMVAVVSAFL